jgi:hypothetical protein
MITAIGDVIIDILRINRATAAQDEAKFMFKSWKFRNIRGSPLVQFDSTQGKFKARIIPNDIPFYETGSQIWGNIMVGNSEGLWF